MANSVHYNNSNDVIITHEHINERVAAAAEIENGEFNFCVKEDRELSSH